MRKTQFLSDSNTNRLMRHARAYNAGDIIATLQGTKIIPTLHATCAGCEQRKRMVCDSLTLLCFACHSQPPKRMGVGRVAALSDKNDDDPCQLKQFKRMHEAETMRKRMTLKCMSTEDVEMLNASEQPWLAISSADSSQRKEMLMQPSSLCSGRLFWDWENARVDELKVIRVENLRDKPRHEIEQAGIRAGFSQNELELEQTYEGGLETMIEAIVDSEAQLCTGVMIGKCSHCSTHAIMCFIDNELFLQCSRGLENDQTAIPTQTHGQRVDAARVTPRCLDSRHDPSKWPATRNSKFTGMTKAQAKKWIDEQEWDVDEISGERSTWQARKSTNAESSDHVTKKMGDLLKCCHAFGHLLGDHAMLAASHSIEKDDAAQVLTFFRKLFLQCMDKGVIDTLNAEDMTKVMSDPATYMTYAYETREEKKSELLWVSDSTCLAAGEATNASSSRGVNRLKAQMGNIYKNIQVQCKGDARSPQLFSQTIGGVLGSCIHGTGQAAYSAPHTYPGTFVIVTGVNDCCHDKKDPIHHNKRTEEEQIFLTEEHEASVRRMAGLMKVMDLVIGYGDYRRWQLPDKWQTCSDMVMATHKRSGKLCINLKNIFQHLTSPKGNPQHFVADVDVQIQLYEGFDQAMEIHHILNDMLRVGRTTRENAWSGWTTQANLRPFMDMDETYLQDVNNASAHEDNEAGILDKCHVETEQSEEAERSLREFASRRVKAKREMRGETPRSMSKPTWTGVPVWRQAEDQSDANIERFCRYAGCERTAQIRDGFTTMRASNERGDAIDMVKAYNYQCPPKSWLR